MSAYDFIFIPAMADYTQQMLGGLHNIRGRVRLLPVHKHFAKLGPLVVENV